MTKRISALFCALLLATMATMSAVQAQALKVGYADPEVIITYMPDYQRIQQQMSDEYQASQEALQSLATDFQEAVAQYQKQQPLLSAERQAEREQELMQMQAEIQESAARKDEELTEKNDSLLAPLLTRVQTVIDEIALERGLDLVVRSPALLYVNQSTVSNINVEIARRLGIEVDEEDLSGNEG